MCLWIMMWLLLLMVLQLFILMKSLNFEISKHPDDLSIVCVEYRLD